MSVHMTKNMARQKDFTITMVAGDVVEIRVNDSPLITATVTAGTSGVARISYQENVL